MKLRLRVLNSWWLKSADYEMFGETDFNYGFALPKEIQSISKYKCEDNHDVEWSLTLSQLLKGHNGHKVSSEKISVPTSEHGFDEYEYRDYVTEEEIEENEDLTFFYFTSNRKKYYLYDVVKYKGKILHLYLDE